MLPGVAAIAVWMLIVALMGVFAVLNGHVPRQMGLLLVLPVCTLIVVGVFGLLRMRRWGWALVMAGAIISALWRLLLCSASRTRPSSSSAPCCTCSSSSTSSARKSANACGRRDTFKKNLLRVAHRRFGHPKCARSVYRTCARIGVQF